MALIDWNSNFSVDLAEFDLEHQKLVAMINSLHAAMKAGKGREAMGTLLDEISDYVLKHFAHEEKLMVQHSYPKYKEHKTAHDDFVKKVKELRSLHDQKLLQANQFLNMLRDWLINHICNTDKQYSSFFLAVLKK